MTGTVSQEILHKSNYVLKRISFPLLTRKTNMSTTSSQNTLLPFLKKKNMRRNDTFPPKRRASWYTKQSSKEGTYYVRPLNRKRENEDLGSDVSTAGIQLRPMAGDPASRTPPFWGIAGKITTENEGWVYFRDYNGLEISWCLCCLQRA